MKILCSKCKGNKIVPDMTERVFTFGISWIFDKLTGSSIGYEKCKFCNSKGYNSKLAPIQTTPT